MKEEFASLKTNETWVYVPAGRHHIIGSRWVFRIKTNTDGSTRLKARVVIKGYEQVEGSDYGETFAPVAKLVSFRLLLAMAAKNAWFIDHMDVVVRREPISKSCEITQADNLNRRRRLSRKAQ